MTAKRTIRRWTPLLCCGGAVVLAIAACGGTKTSTSTTSTGSGASSARVAPATMYERGWVAAIESAASPAPPRAWNPSDQGGVVFANRYENTTLGTPLGDTRALIEARCSSPTVITPSVSYSPGVSGTNRTATLAPFRCAGFRLAHGVAVYSPNHWEGSEVINDVGRYAGGAFSFRLARPAAVQIAFYEPKGQKTSSG